MYEPVDGDGNEGEYARANRDHGYELVDLAVELAEGPVTVEHVYVVEDDVQGGHHGVGDAEVDQEVIGNGAHALVLEDDPDDDDVTGGGDYDHVGEQDRPEDLTPQGQDELVVHVGVVPGGVLGPGGRELAGSVV